MIVVDNGSDRQLDGGVGVVAFAVAVTEAGDEEQGVIDADTETDQERELCREVRSIQDVGKCRDQPTADA